MKKLKLGLLSMLIASIFIIGCDKNENSIEELSAETISVKTAETEMVIDEISDEASVIIEEAYLTEEYPTTKSNLIERYLPECVTITKVITQNTKSVTIDFGEGCELRNGNIVSGEIIINYEISLELASKNISYSYNNFYFNEKYIEGSGTILRERVNSNGNPQSTKNFNITVTWPDNSFAKKAGVKAREMIEGQSTTAWGDNVFLVTGNWEFTKKNGTTLSATIMEALRRELTCKFFVSGTIELIKNENNGILNYGDSSCDDLATISINGGSESEIHLSKL